MSRRRGPSSRRRWQLLSAAVVAGPLLAEVGLREVLFSDWGPVRSLGASLRQPGLFADQSFEDEYWILSRRFVDDPALRAQEPKRADPALGWVSTFVEPETYEHAHDRPDDPRRRLLLYGASFTVLLDRQFDADELARDWCLLNHGVGGYGIDQVLLLLRATLERHVVGAPPGRPPVVVIGHVIPEDFQRSALTIRGWPKPCFRLDPEGRLVLEREVQPTVAEVLGEPTGIRSYLVRAFLHQGSPLPEERRRAWSGVAALAAENDRVVRAVITAIQAELRRHAVPSFYLLFQPKRRLAHGGDAGPDERRLLELFDELDQPFVESATVMRERMAAEGLSVDDVFEPEGVRRQNHPNALGRELLVDALRVGLERLTE